MEIYKNDYWIIKFEQEFNIMATIWFESSSSVNDEIYKKEMIQYAEMVEKYKPSKLVVDTTKFGYVISPEIQTWTNETVFPRGIAAGLRNVAIVVPADIITHLSLEQTMEEAMGMKFVTRYFADYNEAYNWLKAL